ncbi:hypothetical protein [Altericista sp. CCNU0014]|uniref:hypothetical protein n=1 Tax=Altericista sp. CCNU0014 TaxID=3082949 RepID=UPI00384B327B
MRNGSDLGKASLLLGDRPCPRTAIAPKTFPCFMLKISAFMRIDCKMRQTPEPLTREISPDSLGQHEQPTVQPTPACFWDKADRIVVMTIGGASIGGAIGLVHGAIVGATVAALYGWYIGFAKTKSEPTN